MKTLSRVLGFLLQPLISRLLPTPPARRKVRRSGRTILIPPTAEEWNRFWEKEILKGRRSIWSNCTASEYPLCVAAIAERGYRKVLIVGNGLSFDPFVFATAGLQVDALDISSTATDLMRTFTPDDPEVAAYTEQWLQRAVNGLSPMIRPAEKPRFICGSSLDSSFCPDPYDIVIAGGILESHLQTEDFSTLCRALVKRTQPEGLILTTINECKQSQDEPFEIFQSLGCAAADVVDHRLALRPGRNFFVGYLLGVAPVITEIRFGRG